MDLTKYEQETIINYNEKEPTASVYTHSRKLRSKLSKIAKDNPDCKIYKETEDYCEFIVPKKWVKVSPTKKMSEENKRKMGERARKMAAERRDHKDNDET